ncbi:MAG: ribose 5-phosphate isomerase B [bacterium (Candidatus Ratteibacteria) CG_4_10_14_3_um_filter_41_18]|uniref:Ribose 5-phosphate isomerase B n=4 Tax=Candidatus Ratteibacteria TaxID=2979319 RepID=A0A2M7YG45_9BACT|nr:MAG: ribose 5-phosphate isomerase B [Candidatus Omnitrophica bacterium CG1_02_41_171]PIW33763.1 MAG: ribose 5-phosphate isomerase B [bacterium (Candidatus Ratteibacteria) CG15_BIG_FIL_POST_REV_8_21_14_020_41_12]PIX77195.1 MAG: ribose 5-phosphate isomerase B [bacterium (Candidatus Ratteibacteria) CG_4_10_14_3_um_filter_41_18]PJA61936.1 MAG: ribose 5-phosphate isomerase B [bacterium (Candidatus Ratteibacteria) CG_4_9_14_3_um_filter_41_21]HCG77019.1 ribose 5-phosphate isomerase B [bacterium]
MKIGIGSDHAGYRLKEELKKQLRKEGYEIVDFGTRNNKSADYPGYGLKVAESVSKKEVERGVLICGTGLGMAIVANKVKGVRAACCNDLFSARLSRLHNDANVLTLGGRILALEFAWEIVTLWLETPFSRGKHSRRINQIKSIEKERFI